jgi:putative hydrolase of the HAD superfamily
MPFSNVRLISFDLDNTLYDNRPVIALAEKKSREYLDATFRQQQKRFDFAQFSAIRQKLLDQQNSSHERDSRYDDLTRLRRDVLLEICSPLDGAEKIVEQALNLFLEHRSLATIPQPIQKMMEQLAKNYTVVSVTNGNCRADLLSCGSLFQQNYSPTHGFRAKPHPEMLEQVSEDFSLSTEQILHIGDSESSDGDAARAAGCHFYFMSPFYEGRSDYSSIVELLSQLKLT